ncbi:WhiB family transcriptional regulator [Streptomyces sp. NPDC001404]|uniref:WhiB family transcriptional regulator n=1 Tax=Streptomyces sp. NPDC001404 TaxID=3364571 RepID=UPI0036D08042
MSTSRTTPTDRISWASAACAQKDADPEWWHSNLRKDRVKARARCRNCPLQEPCLAEAMHREGDARAADRKGIYGGLDGQQRHKYHTTGIRPDPVEPPAQPLHRTTGRTPSGCGTEAAYQRHLRKGEAICTPCREAHRARAVRQRAARKAERQAEFVS